MSGTCGLQVPDTRFAAPRTETALPEAIWLGVLIGAAARIMLTWLNKAEGVVQHIVLTAVCAGLLGLLIFLIAALDTPYRGEMSIGPQAFQHVLEHMGRI